MQSDKDYLSGFVAVLIVAMGFALNAQAGTWFIVTLDQRLLVWGEAWGGPGFMAVQGDYNADGISDLAVYYDGYWFVETVDGTLIFYAENWGAEDYDPVGR